MLISCLDMRLLDDPMFEAAKALGPNRWHFWLVFPAISKEALATHELTRPAEGASLLHEAAPSLLPAVHEALQRKPTEPGVSANVTELMAKGQQVLRV